MRIRRRNERPTDQLLLSLLGDPLVVGTLTLAVITLGPALVTDKLRILPLGGAETLLLRPLDAIAVGLIGLITGCVVLLFHHV